MSNTQFISADIVPDCSHIEVCDCVSTYELEMGSVPHISQRDHIYLHLLHAFTDAMY